MKNQQLILNEIKEAPESVLAEVLDFIKFLKQKNIQDKAGLVLASESSLKKDWLTPEEEDAWKGL